MNNIIHQLLNFLSFCICYCYLPKDIAVRDSLDYGTNTHTQVWYGTGEGKKKSMDGHYNLLKELKENEKDRFIKCLEYMYLVILFKEKNVTGYEIEPGLQIRTGPRAISLSTTI